MKLNKPIITICIIILLVVNLIFFSFLSIGKNITNKKNLEELLQEFNFKEYVLNNETISNSISNYKYPKEVFNYMDEIKIKSIKNTFINNLYNRNEELINKNDIKELLSNSVYEYEYKNKKDIYEYVIDDINSFSTNLHDRFSKSFVDDYYTAGGIVNVLYYISIALSIIFISIIIFIEKKNGLLASSIILILYSFFLFYMDRNLVNKGFMSLSKYFNKINLNLNTSYIICFILGFVLLLIYIVKRLKEFLRDLRIRSYMSSWR